MSKNALEKRVQELEKTVVTHRDVIAKFGLAVMAHQRCFDELFKAAQEVVASTGGRPEKLGEPAPAEPAKTS